MWQNALVLVFHFFRKYYEGIEMKEKKRKLLRKCKRIGLHGIPFAAATFMISYWIVGLGYYYKE